MNVIKHSANRFRALDGLRGVAAMMVVLYHLAGNLQPDLAGVFPSFLNTALGYGYLGVPIFFVISGFVISMSVGDSRVTAGYAGNFAFRRMVRLDPTYWASIVFALLLLAMKNRFLGESEPMPNLPVVLLHMFYLQDLVQAQPIISVVYWTLCLEVQLYLFFIFCVWLSQRVAYRSALCVNHIMMCIVLSVGLASIALDYRLWSVPVPGLFLSNWHYFLLGVLLLNYVKSATGSGIYLLAWLACESLFLIFMGPKAYAAAGVTVTLFIIALYKKNFLGSVLASAPLQYLGLISYTLYLVHPDVGWKVISFGKYYLGDGLGAAAVIGLLIAGITVSVLTAHVFHLLFEKPSLRFASYLKRPAQKYTSLHAGEKSFDS